VRLSSAQGSAEALGGFEADGGEHDLTAAGATVPVGGFCNLPLARAIYSVALLCHNDALSATTLMFSVLLYMNTGMVGMRDQHTYVRTSSTAALAADVRASLVLANNPWHAGCLDLVPGAALQAAGSYAAQCIR